MTEAAWFGFWITIGLIGLWCVMVGRMLYQWWRERPPQGGEEWDEPWQRLGGGGDDD